jgi:hypothetical protein
VSTSGCVRVYGVHFSGPTMVCLLTRLLFFFLCDLVHRVRRRLPLPSALHISSEPPPMSKKQKKKIARDRREKERRRLDADLDTQGELLLVCGGDCQPVERRGGCLCRSHSPKLLFFFGFGFGFHLPVWFAPFHQLLSGVSPFLSPVAG